MNILFKKLYLGIEQFTKDKPFLFWLLTTLLISIPVFSFWNKFKTFLLTEYIFKGYQPLILFVLILIIIVFILKKPNTLKQQILKELESIKIKLNNPFNIEKVSYPSSTKYTETFYHSEILECFEDYNKIIKLLKNKWPERFADLKTRDCPRVQGGDWVYESVMQVVKSDVISLIEKLK